MDIELGHRSQNRSKKRFSFLTDYGVSKLGGEGKALPHVARHMSPVTSANNFCNSA
jgi:hypothetical protein